MGFIDLKGKIFGKIRVTDALLIAIIFFMAGGAIIQNRLLATIFLVIALSLLFLMITAYAVKKTETKKKKFLIYTISIALVLKIFFMIILHNVFLFPDELGVYDHFAWLKARDWLGGEKFDLPGHSQVGNVTVYYYFVSIIYFLFGHNIIIAKLFNIFLSVSAGILLFLLTKEIFNERIGMISFVTFLFFPSINFYSFPLLRESLILFLLIAAFLSLTVLIKKFNLRHFLFFALSILLMYKVRYYITTIFLSAGIFYSLYNLLIVKTKKGFYLLLFLITLILIINPNYIGYIKKVSNILSPERIEQRTAQEPEPKAESIPTTKESPSQSVLSFLDNQRRALSYGTTAFKKEVRYDSHRGFLKYLPYRTAYFFFSPIFLEVNSVNIILLYLIELSYFVILPFAFLGSYLSLIKKPQLTLHLILFIILFSALHIVIESNVGTLLRHRIQIVPFLIVFASYGFSKFIRWKNGEK